MSSHSRRQLALVALAVLLAMTLWFSATAVLAQLQQAWQLSPTAAVWVTAAVQLGFVSGALGSALLNLADVVPARRLCWMACAAGAVIHLILAWLASSVPLILGLRFATGVCLACVYPPGMKIAAGHVEGRGRGLAIGLIVGALTLGSATPHLLAGLLEGAALPFRLVMSASSAFALCAALIVGRFVSDGPYASRPAPFDVRQVGRVLQDRAVLLANLGYFGHMWELYAVWTWLSAFLAAALGAGAAVRLHAFVIIGVAGGAGALSAGVIADRIGRTTVAIGALLTSAACCLLSPWAYALPPAALLAFGLIWGASIIADSAQFSSAVTELADPAYLGTALALQTSLGFALTLLPIWSLPYLAAETGWRYAFVVLAPGPLLGAVAMAALRRRPEAERLAGGKR